jgi:hypothetical protein
MKTHSGSTSEGFLPPLQSANSGGGTAVAPAPEDPTATFADVLHQQQGSAPATPRSATPFSNALADAKLGTTPSTAPAMPAPAPWTTAAATTSSPATTNPPTPAAVNVPVAPSPNMTALTTALAVTTPVTAKPKDTKLPANQPAPDDATESPENDDDTPAAGSKTLLASSDLSMMLARAGILAANARQAPTSGTTTPAATTTSASDAVTVEEDASHDAPLFAWETKAASPSTTEKKSASTTSERSFIQPDTSMASALGMALIGTSSPISYHLQQVSNQSVTTPVTTPATGTTDAATDALASAGMGSVKKEHEMNATLDMTDLMVSNGSTPLVTRTSADVNILLGTNNDFKDALAQVMHVAELSNLSASTPPLRVAIEIQTPPGAVVNLYVSKMPDNTYRVQLGTDDVQALNWVQGQIGSLKQSTDTGVEVRWLPAQLETTSFLTTSSSGESGLGWNRGGGQGQWQGQQQGEERQQSPRQKRPAYANALSPELSIPFIGALGRAA